MKSQSQISVQQKLVFSILLLVMLFVLVDNAFDLYDSKVFGLQSVEFLNNLRDIIVKLFYVYAGYLLYSILRNKSIRFINLLSEEGVKIFSKLYYVLLSLVLFKLLFQLFRTIFTVLPIGGKSFAYNFGYLIGNSFTKGAIQNIDLLMSLIIVWVFIIVLKQSNKLKQENDLTI